MSFDFEDPNSVLCFDDRMRRHLLALSKVLRKTHNLSTKNLTSLLETLVFPWSMYRYSVLKLQRCNNLSAKVFLLEPLITITVQCWVREFLEKLN